jgi:hypothetical protein
MPTDDGRLEAEGAEVEVPELVTALEEIEPSRVDVEVFGHRLRGVLPGNAEDLITLEKEGALYSHFWTDDVDAFRYFRVPLLPHEIVQFVEGAVGSSEFETARLAGATLDEALNAISNRRVRELVRTYPVGVFRTEHGDVEADIRGCFASFLPRELEDVICGGRRDRYQPLPDLGDERSRLALVKTICQTFPVVASHLAGRGRGRPPIAVENEYDVQDLLYVNLRAIFADTRYEEWTPQIAGRSKRIDLVLPELEVVIEVKMIRNAGHGRSVVDELMVDFESYHSHANCRVLLALVYDPGHHVPDAQRYMSELSGTRVKNGHTFDVEVIIVR